MQEDITEYLFKSLRALNEEYDAVIKEKEILQRNRRGTGNGDNGYFVNDVLERSINVIRNTEEKWEEKEEESKILAIQKLSSEKERATCARRRAELERRRNLEKLHIDYLNKIINDTIPLAEGREIIEEKLTAVILELDKLSVNETIYPSAILEIYSVCDELKKKVEEMESSLLKYTDLPPDYAKAKEKLAEAQMTENKLGQRIRLAIKRN